MIAYSLLSNNVLSCCYYVISSQDTKKGHNNVSLLLQRYQDSNLEMLESESSALPFGDSAILTDSKRIKRGQEDSNPRPFGP